MGNAADAAHDPEILGQDELRKAAANRVMRVSGKNYDWKSQCIIAAGGMSGILNFLLVMLEAGDEVIVTDPTYAGIINRICIAGGVTKFVRLIPTYEGWRLDINAQKRDCIKAHYHGWGC